MYVMDNHAIEDVVKCMQFGSQLNDAILESLADMFKAENAYVREFKDAASLDVPQLEVRISAQRGSAELQLAARLRDHRSHPG